MATVLEQQLARALAAAVKHETELLDGCRQYDPEFPQRPWIPDAVQALALYSAQRDSEKNFLNY